MVLTFHNISNNPFWAEPHSFHFQTVTIDLSLTANSYHLNYRTATIIDLFLMFIDDLMY